MPTVTPGSLIPLAQGAAAALRESKGTVTVFEATTAGLVQAALQTVPGASGYTTCGGITYHTSRATPLLGRDMSSPKPSNSEEYMNAKKTLTAGIAKRMRGEVGAVWSVSESGACGPTFNVPDMAAGFTVVSVCGPIERSVLVRSSHARREENMWGFAKAALDLLQECVREHMSGGNAAAEETQVLKAKEDRYGGVEIEVTVSDPATAGPHTLRRALESAVEGWKAAGKRGLWLRIPLGWAEMAAGARDAGFALHHAKPDYLLMTRWLPQDVPSPLPLFAFTQIGVGGVVINRSGQVLMVQERVSPTPQFQGSWKLPGGLADPGEDFADTVAREVREETGVECKLVGVVSLRHTHGLRFGQGDLYVLVKLIADSDALKIDYGELLDAKWMSPDQIQALVVPAGQSLDGKVSEANGKMIHNALHGSLILGTPLPSSRSPRPAMLYTAPSPASSNL